MDVVERDGSIYRRECAECGTLMQPAKVLCPANSEHIGARFHEYVPVEQLRGAEEVGSKALRLADALYRAVEFEAGKGQAIEDEIKALYARLSAESYLQNKQEVVYLDDDLMANLDQRAVRNKTDRAGYLRWILTGKTPTAIVKDS